jgi:DNA-3-methyladenine glycosylase II
LRAGYYDVSERPPAAMMTDRAASVRVRTVTDLTPGEQMAHVYLTGLDDPIAALVHEQGIIQVAHSNAALGADGYLGWLVFNIVSQQISVAAARAIYGRLTKLIGEHMDPVKLADASQRDLRSAGLSSAKARAVQEMGAAVSGGNFAPDALDDMSDEQAMATLVALRGIGPWSAQMFLMHTLQRADIFPGGDSGLRRAIARIDQLAVAPTIPEAEARAAAWCPYRSYAASHLWLYLETLNQ